MGRFILMRMRWFAVAACFLLPCYFAGQEAQVQPAPEAPIPTKPAPPETATPPAPAATTPATNLPAAAEKLAVPRNAQDFKFTNVDLELLRQVNAFDSYMDEKGWVYNDPETNAYLESIGLSLVPRETPENVLWRFRAIRDLEINAFALPNGSIYVTTGLLSRMENEAQLAGVLAHEVTHVTNRHTYLEYRSARKKMVAIDVMVAAASAASYGGVNPGIVNAMGNLAPLILVGTIFGYSREMEHEADVYAVNTLYLHGYDLRQFSRGFELLKKGPEVDLSEEPEFWASHPKLADRVKYVATTAARLQPSPAGWRVEEAAYRSSTRNVIRHNAGLAMLLGRPRTAVAIAQRLAADEPNNAENLVLLGDAYRTLGARTPLPNDDELKEKAKDKARERIRRMTVPEYDKALLADPHGTERWEANTVRSEEAFHKALAIDPKNATAHRGLGFLAERRNQSTVALEEFRKYLELSPGANDYRQIKLHIDNLEKQASRPSPAEEPKPAS